MFKPSVYDIVEVDSPKSSWHGSQGVVVDVSRATGKYAVQRNDETRFFFASSLLPVINKKQNTQSSTDFFEATPKIVKSPIFVYYHDGTENPASFQEICSTDEWVLESPELVSFDKSEVEQHIIDVLGSNEYESCFLIFEGNLIHIEAKIVISARVI